MASYVIGIDEVGRGPLAGPVAVGGFLVPADFNFGYLTKLAGVPIRDSKKLPESMRDAWFAWVIRNMPESYYVSTVSNRVIDLRGLRYALTEGSMRVLRVLLRRLPVKSKLNVYLDGSLYLRGQSRKPTNKLVSFSVPEFEINIMAQTVVKGDVKIPVISLAAILAKVHRDNLMRLLDVRFPGYGFGKNKGYGTASHLLALDRLGPSPIHRLTFIGKYLKVTSARI